MPEIGKETGQEWYTPRKLEAMAHLAIGVHNHNEEKKQLQEAVTLAPDSAAAQYYWGRYWIAYMDTIPEAKIKAKEAFQQAAQLGDTRTIKAAKDYLQLFP